jgi:hypothetical protein
MMTATPGGWRRLPGADVRYAANHPRETASLLVAERSQRIAASVDGRAAPAQRMRWQNAGWQSDSAIVVQTGQQGSLPLRSPTGAESSRA